MLELGGTCHSKWGAEPWEIQKSRSLHSQQERLVKSLQGGMNFRECRHVGQNRELGSGSHIGPPPRVRHS